MYCGYNRFYSQLIKEASSDYEESYLNYNYKALLEVWLSKDMCILYTYLTLAYHGSQRPGLSHSKRTAVPHTKTPQAARGGEEDSPNKNNIFWTLFFNDNLLKCLDQSRQITQYSISQMKMIVLYFDQHLDAAHFKHCLKLAFSHVFAIF